jgi:hypothetical protein
MEEEDAGQLERVTEPRNNQRIVIQLTPPHSRRGSTVEEEKGAPDDEHIEWVTCCSKSSKGFVKFVVQLCICAFVLVFSAVMIILNPEEDNSIYFSLLSSILTLYIPAPSLTK